MIDLDLCLDVV